MSPSEATRATAFGRLVKQHRIARNLTQQSVADNARISVTYVGLIEQGQRGRKPSRDVTKRLCEALGLSLSDAEELFRAAGYLEPHEALYLTQTGEPEPERVASVPVAVDADVLLTDSQKKMLLDLYAECVRVRSNGHARMRQST